MSEYLVCGDCDHPALDWRRCDSCEEAVLPCGCNLGTIYYREGQDPRGEEKPKGLLCLACYEDAKESREELEP